MAQAPRAPADPESMIRRALLVLLVLALLAPEAASAASNGGVAAPTTASGGTIAGQPAVVRAPRPPKKHRKHRKKRRRSHPAPAATPAGTHVFPVAGPFTWPGPAGEFGAGRTGHIHQGFDLLAPQGTPVVAPYAGTITFVDYQAGGAGYYVVLHADYDYAFMHLAKGSTRVTVGEVVAAGARIGDVGQTGDASGPHLHFEVWQGPWQQGGTPIDPAPLLRSWAPT
jgi:murein DD-endopeptidase MepM/ murein hydrolase activator NlpD